MSKQELANQLDLSQTTQDKSTAWLADLAVLTIAASFVSIAASNAAAITAVVLVIVYAYKTAARVNRLPFWALALVGLLAVRALSAFSAVDSKIAWPYLAKDWHMLALAIGLAYGYGKLIARRWSVYFLIVTLAAAIVYAGLQFFSVAQHWTWLPVPRGTTLAQTGAFLKQPMTLGGVAMLTLFAPAVLRLPKQTGLIVAALALALLLISGVRSAWLGAAAGAICFAIQRKIGIKRLLVAAILMGAIVAALPMSRTRIKQAVDQYNQIQIDYGSFARRLELWQVAAQMGSSRLLGVGPGNFRQESAKLLRKNRSIGHAHSMPLHIFAETGWPGLLAWLLWSGAIVAALLKSDAPTTHAGLPIVASMLTAGLFEVNQYDGEIANIYYLLLGICLSGTIRFRTRLSKTLASDNSDITCGPANHSPSPHS